MPICVECGQLFEQKVGIRPMKFCGRKCRDKQTKRIDYKRSKAILIERPCDVCGTPFQQTKRNQRYCCRLCYTQAECKLHPERNNARQKKRRETKHEWYAEHDPKYYMNYRTKQLQRRPWRYVFQSRRLAAKADGIPFELTDEWAKARWTGRCEITGLLFLKNPNGRGPWPFSCTIDKIDAKLGYTQANSRFILSGCNGLKGVGTDVQMYEIAAAITKAHFRSDAAPAEAVLSFPA